MTYDFVVVGGGIVGLATAVAILERQPGLRGLLIEKENHLAAHQTGRNSGVIHSGIYYKPGSLKARLGREGNATMVRFCREHGIAHEICGKVILATSPQEIPLLDNLQHRGRENGLAVERLTPEEMREREPYVSCVAGLFVPSTGIVSYSEVCKCLAELFQSRGGVLQLGARVERVRLTSQEHVLETPLGAFKARFLVNCAGLHSDRLAHMAGKKITARIVPFRGEYYELAPEQRNMVRTLVYPVPNPDFPFLGVHLTRMIDGSVHAGPNAVLALAREGYKWSNISLRDTFDTFTYPGFWRLAARNLKEGLKEIHRSLSLEAFLRSLQRLIPALQREHLVPSTSGVRAQALAPNGTLVDDFLLVADERAMHVCNAPSPAATASLEIARKVAHALPDLKSQSQI